MTFLDLYTEVISLLFPEGQPENLQDSHKRFVNDALFDLSKNVDCLKFGNVNIINSCATYFNCGMTVLPAPRGRILKVYTLGKKPGTTAPIPATTYASMVNLIPAMTSDTMPLGEVAASINSPVAYRAFDGDPTHTWNSESLPQWIQYKFDTPTVIDQYSSFQGGLYTFEKDWTFSGSNDGLTWTVLDTRVGYSEFLPGSNVFTFTNSTAYYYYRINITKANGLTAGQDADYNTISGIKMGKQTVPNVIGGNEDWCSKVFYDQVEYCHIEEYVRLSRHCGTPNSIFSSALIQNLFGCGWRNKRRYPCPTDAGFETLPSLPQGFHYPQASTDAGGRSRGGVWALYRGRIYIAPWIESDETVVVEWNGIKDTWSDDDLVEDDSKFRQAVRLNVAVQHYSLYEQDQQKLVVLETQWREALRDLIHECREQNRIRSCNEAGGSGASARGLGAGDVATALYYNEELPSYTASCPTGQVGTSVTVPIPANQVGSALSVADANAKALAQATADAISRLSCSVAPTIFYNVAVIGQASCPGASGDTPAATGSEVTVPIAAGLYSSTLPNGQDVANAAAQAEADRRANLQLVCTFHNAPQTATGSCPANTTGTDQSVTVPANDAACDSTTSQAAADALAETKAANLLAAQLLVACVGIPTYLIGNEQKSYTNTGILSCGSGYTNSSYPVFTYTSIIPANWKTALVTAATEVATRLSLNQQAQAAAQSNWESQYNFAQNAYQSGCRPAVGGGIIGSPISSSV